MDATESKGLLVIREALLIQELRLRIADRRYDMFLFCQGSVRRSELLKKQWTY